MPDALTADPLAAIRHQVLTDPKYGRVYLQELPKRSFLYFCRHILGYADLNAEHEALCDFVQYEPATTRLILMPRYTFKSSIVTIAKNLWRLLCDPNEKLLIYSDSTEKAEGFLTGIKNHILGLNSLSKFRAVCGPWEVDAKRGVWNQSAIVIAPRTQAAVEPSIDTAGLETSKVGKHYGEITFDDLVSDKNVTTKDLMDKVEQCYKKAGSLLQPSGRTDLDGTRWHFGDLYGRLLAEYQGQKDFAVFHRKAFEGTRYFFNDIGKDSLTPQFLAQKKATQGSALFSMLYQNEPVDDETATFKAADFRFYNPSKTDAFTQWLSTLYITCVLDAIPPPTSDHGDDAAITVVGTDHAHTMFLLDAVAGRLTPEQQIEEVFSLHAVWKFHKFGLETNAFQRMFKSMFENRLMAERKQPKWQPFSIVEFDGLTMGHKEQRIQGLQPWHERGLIRFPGTKLELLTGVWSVLAYQMLQFPHSQKDDCLDSLSRHLQLKQAGTESIAPSVIPYRSAAWAVKEQEVEEVEVMARRPRWQRKPVEAMVFGTTA